MGVFDLFKGDDINSKLEEARGVKGAVILDVRESHEFEQGHVPGAINVSVNSIEKISKKVKHKDTPIFTYCLSGARSGRAVAALKEMGYTNVTNMGGINKYKGEIER